MRCSAAATHASTCVAGSGQPVESVESHLWPKLTRAQLSYARRSILTRSLELLYLPTRRLRSYLLWVYLLRAGAAPLCRVAQACAVAEPHARRTRGGELVVAYRVHSTWHPTCALHTTCAFYTACKLSCTHTVYTSHIHCTCTTCTCLQVLENLLLSHRLRVGRFPGPMYLACCEPGQARAEIMT